MLTIARVIAAFGVGVLVLAGGGVRADPSGPETLVVGHGDPALDVPAVQAAVSAGGRVTLSGLFDFGASGRVVITRDVRIRGTGDATVRGGFFSFFSPLPPLPVTGPGPAISITHLTFEGALHSPVHIAYASGVEIGHNTIRDVRPRFVPAFGYFAHQGLIVGTYGQYPPVVVPGALTGRIRVHQNDIDMTSPNPASTLCMGVFLNRTWGSDVSVTENAVSGCARNALEVLDNHRDEAGAGQVEISHNRLRGWTTGVPYPNSHRPNGIVAGWFFDPGGATDPARNPRIRISENRIELEAPEATGIFAASNGVVIEENRLTVSGVNARGIYLGSSDGLVAENSISGNGQIAIDVSPFYPAILVPANRNTAACNDVSRFHALVADLHLGGNDNTVIGFAGTVLDTGTGNQLVAGDGCD